MTLKQFAKSKYGNVKTTVYGIEFDSKKEAQRYLELRSMLESKMISNLERQVKFEVIPSQVIEGRKQRACHYIADFQYDMDGKRIVEDVKGYRTDAYRLKRLLMKWIHGIEVLET